MQHQLMLARLVGEVLRHEHAVRGQTSHRAQLVFEHARGVFRRVRGQPGPLQRLAERGGASARRVLPARQQGAVERARFVGARGAVALPERRGRALRRGVRNDHAVARDFLDFPWERAQIEFVAQPSLEHVLLVQLAQPRAVGKRYGEPAAVGNRAAGGQRQHARVRVAAHAPGQPVVDQARLYGAVVHALVVARKHAKHRLHVLGRKAAIAVGAGKHAHGLVHRVRAGRRHGDQMLRKHVQTHLRRVNALDATLACRLTHQRAADGLGGRARIDAHAAHAPGAVPRAPQPLQKRRYAWRRADLNDQIDFAHVNAQLHGGRSHHHAQLAAFEHALGLEPLLLRHAAVMRARERLPRALVDFERQPLAARAPVHKRQHRARMIKRLKHAVGNRRPHAVLRQLPHVRHGHVHGQLRALFDFRHDYGARPAAGQMPRGLLRRVHRGGKPHAAHVPSAQRVQPRQRKKQVRAPLGGQYRVQLVHDYRARAFQHFAPGQAREQQIQRFRRGNQYVRRVLRHFAPRPCVGIAGAHGDAHGVRQMKPRQRALQILPNVVAQRLQRRNVYEAQSLRKRARVPLAAHFVQKIQKRRQRFARAGGRGNQRVAPLRNCLPAHALRLGGRSDGGKKPLARFFRKALHNTLAAPFFRSYIS